MYRDDVGNDKDDAVEDVDADELLLIFKLELLDVGVVELVLKLEVLHKHDYDEGSYHEEGNC